MSGTCDAKDCQCKQEKGKLKTVMSRSDVYKPKLKTIMSRSDVYKLIDGERDYQDNKWRHLDDGEWAINDWIVFIERYVKECKEWTGHPNEQMDSMRKIGALAVASMEYKHTRPRNGGIVK